MEKQSAGLVRWEEDEELSHRCYEEEELDSLNGSGSWLGRGRWKRRLVGNKGER